MRNRFLSIFLTSLLTLAILSFQVQVTYADDPQSESSGWWSPEWRYRRRIDITENSGYSLTNFPVEVTFNHDGKAQLDGDDIRVVIDGLEVPSYILDLNGTLAKVMFEVNVTASSIKTVYVYYGNPDAAKPNYPLVPLTISEGNNGHAIIDNLVYIGWAYTSWGWSNNVELWNDFRIDLNGNNDPTDDNDLIFGDYNNRQEGIGRSRRDLQAYGLGEYQNYVCNPIFVQINFVDAWLRVFRGNRWVETIQADHLNMFSNTWDFMNYGGGSEINIVDGDVEVSMHNSYSNPGWMAFRNSISGLVFASSGFGIGGYSMAAEEYYGYSIVAKEYSDFDRRMTFDIWRTDFYPFNPYDQPTNCRIYWYGDNSNNYSKIEKMAQIFNNQPSILVGSEEVSGPYIVIDQAFVSDERVDAGSTQTIGFHAKWDNGSDVVGGTINIERTIEKRKITLQKISVGLVGYWKFDEGSGTRVYDSTGFENTGTLINEPTWVDGKHGRALSFDGVNDYVEIPHSASLDIVNEITVEAWVKPLYTNYGETPTKVIVGKHGGWNNRGWSIGAKHGDLQDIRFHWQAGGDNYLDTATNPLFTGVWTHIVGLANGTHIKIYINGELTVQKRNEESVNYDYPVEIGRNGVAAGSYFKGVIDEVRIYNRALTPKEIEAHTQGLIRIANLSTGQKVELYDSAGNLKASNTVEIGENETLLDVSSLTYPFLGLFKVYAKDGTTLLCTSPMLDIRGGDEYSVSTQIVTEIIDRKEYVTNGTGWVTFNVSSSTVGKEFWTVAGVNASGVGYYSQLVENPSIIWDQVNVTLNVGDSRIDVGRNASITYEAVYGYDGEPFLGPVVLNDTSFSQGYVSKRGYRTLSIIDEKYGLYAFTTNEVYVIWDRVNVTLSVLNPRIGVGSTANISWAGVYEYDGYAFSGSLTLNDTLTKNVMGRYGYAVASITDPLYRLTSFSANEVHCIFDHIKVEYALQTWVPSSMRVIVNLKFEYDGLPVDDAEVRVSGIKAINVGDGVYEATISSWMPSLTVFIEVEREGFELIIFEAFGYLLGNILSEASLITIVSLITILKLNSRRIQRKNWLTNLEKVEELVKEKGRVELRELSESVGVDVTDAKKILSEILKAERVIGTFTTDGEGFVTEEKLKEEIRRGLK